MKYNSCISDISPDSLLRSLKTELKILKDHFSNEHILHPNSIEFWTNRILEQILNLEQVSLNHYNTLDDETKEYVDAAEAVRIKKLTDVYLNGKGSITETVVNNMNEHLQNKYSEIRNTIENRLSN